MVFGLWSCTGQYSFTFQAAPMVGVLAKKKEKKRKLIMFDCDVLLTACRHIFVKVINKHSIFWIVLAQWAKLPKKQSVEVYF